MRNLRVEVIVALLLILNGRGLSEAEDATAPALTAAEQTAVADVDAQADELKGVNRAIWEFAEIGLAEHKSSALLVDKLRANGFDVTTGVSNMPTAFVASYGSGAPIIGILAEYDALPEMSQQVVPYRAPVEEGAAGHACGHCGLGTGALGAVLAVKAAMEEHNLPGTVRLYGTPAEETLIGKVYMQLDGQFDDLDICLHWHPGTNNRVRGGSSKAMVSVKFTFEGIPAHGSVSPHSGRSALDAVELLNIGVNFMREHVKEDARMHYVVTDGGGQPNVVPPDASVWYFIRADKHDDVERNFNWIKDIARGAALMTQTELAGIQIDTDCHEILPNTPLTELLDEKLRAVGAPTFTAEEHEFASRMQQPLIERFGGTFSATINEEVERPDMDPSKGSTDVGDISWHIPTGGINTTCMAEGSPGHSWQNVACIGSSIGEKGILYAAKVLAAATVQLLVDNNLRAAARADFQKRMQDREYHTLIPAGQTAPAAIR